MSIFDIQWSTAPPGTPQRPTVLEAWRADDAYLRSFVDGLSAGRLVLAPQDVHATPIRVVLGDYMGNAGIIRHTATDDEHGVRIEVFSPGVVSTDFVLTESDAARGWDPVGGSAVEPAVRYPSEWSRIPTGDERASLLAAGVDEHSLDLVSWWGDVQHATTVNRRLDFPDDARLPELGMAVHYDPDRFIDWINGKTWRSEWPKYRLSDPPDAPDPRPRIL